MAQMSSSIWKFTSADAGATLHRPANKPWFLLRIQWFNYAAAANTVEVQDGKGETIFETTGNAELDPYEASFGSEGVEVWGLQIPTLAAGQLNIVIR